MGDSNLHRISPPACCLLVLTLLNSLPSLPFGRQYTWLSLTSSAPSSLPYALPTLEDLLYLQLIKYEPLFLSRQGSPCRGWETHTGLVLNEPTAAGPLPLSSHRSRRLNFRLSLLGDEPERFGHLGELSDFITSSSMMTNGTCQILYQPALYKVGGFNEWSSNTLEFPPQSISSQSPLLRDGDKANISDSRVHNPGTYVNLMLALALLVKCWLDLNLI